MCLLRGTLLQIRKFTDTCSSREYAKDFTLHLLLFEICPLEMRKMHVYKHPEETEYVKN